MKPAPHTQNGFTMIEFMVAGTLGLILLAGLLTVFLSSSQTSRSTRAQVEIQNDGRFALRFLRNQIQQAGWSGAGNFSSLSHPLLIVGNLVGDGSSGEVSTAANSIGEDVTAGGTVGDFTVQASDRLVVQYAGTVDCNGTAVAGGIVRDQFEIATVNGVPTLICNNEPVVSNVESFQVNYQLTNRTDPFSVTIPEQRSWLTADAITDSSRIRAVRFAILLASEDVASDSDITRTFTLLNEAGVTRTDRKLRQVFVATVELQNPKVL